MPYVGVAAALRFVAPSAVHKPCRLKQTQVVQSPMGCDEQLQLIKYILAFSSKCSAVHLQTLGVF